MGKRPFRRERKASFGSSPRLCLEIFEALPVKLGDRRRKERKALEVELFWSSKKQKHARVFFPLCSPVRFLEETGHRSGEQTPLFSLRFSSLPRRSVQSRRGESLVLVRAWSGADLRPERRRERGAGEEGAFWSESFSSSSSSCRWAAEGEREGESMLVFFLLRFSIREGTKNDASALALLPVLLFARGSGLDSFSKLEQRIRGKMELRAATGSHPFDGEPSGDSTRSAFSIPRRFLSAAATTPPLPPSPPRLLLSFRFPPPPPRSPLSRSSLPPPPPLSHTNRPSKKNSPSFKKKKK